MKNQLNEIIDKSAMKKYEETSEVWMYTELSAHYGYEISVLGGNDAGRDYVCVRYLRTHGVEPRWLIVENLPEEKSKFSGIPLIGISDYLKKENKSDFVIMTKNTDNSWKRFFKYFTSRRTETYHYYKRHINKLIHFWPEFLRDRCGAMIEFVTENPDRIEWVYNMLEDEISKRTLLEVVRSGINNDRYSETEFESNEKYFGSERDMLYRHLEDEVWINCGSCTGDTILRFLFNRLPFKKVYAYEANEDNVRCMKAVFAYLPDEVREKIEIRQEYLDSHTTLPEIPTLINMDIEGAEMMVLGAMRDTISKHLPVCAICAYHKVADVVDIVAFFREISGEYHFFLRKYVGFDINALNEYVIYAVPEKRMQTVAPCIQKKEI